MKPTPSPQNQEPDQEIIDLLKGLESYRVEYPPELLAARRADFVAQVQQARADKIKQALPAKDQFAKRLKELQSVKAEYPAELLATRRAAFIAQIEERSAVEVTEELSAKDQELIKLFGAMKSAEVTEYPAKLMAARRSAFRRQIALGGRVSLLETLRASIQKLSLFKVKLPSVPTASLMRTSLIIAVLVVAAFATSLLRNREPVFSPAPAQENVSQTVASVTATATAEVVTIVCQPGDQSEMCPPEEIEKSEDLASQGNGAAKPAVANATPSDNGVHKAANVNDGHDGDSWVSSSPNSWIKIDLGKVATINTVSLDKARLGPANDHRLGQFVIAVALSDVYADGNSSNDYVEYTQVYDSEQTNFSGVVSESATVRAMFRPVRARYIKIIFEDPGAAINEVKVFMAQPARFSNTPTKKPREGSPDSQSTPIPVYNTAIPAPTDTAIPAPTRTPLPTDPPATSTPEPTDVPPTDIPPTDVPPTDIPPTDLPPTTAPTVDTVEPQLPIDTSLPVNDSLPETVLP